MDVMNLFLRFPQITYDNFIIPYQKGNIIISYEIPEVWTHNSNVAKLHT